MLPHDERRAPSTGRRRRGSLRATALRVLVVLVGLFSAREALALTCNWNRTTTGVWSDSANWSCGRVPTSADAVTFGPNDGNCSIDTTVDVLASVNIQSTYSGTISESGGSRFLPITGNFTQAGGTLNAIWKITVDGDFSLTGGTFNAPTTLIIGAGFSKSGGTFNAGTGTVVITGSTRTIDFDDFTFNNLSITDGLNGYWRLNESSGSTAADTSGYGVDLTWRSSPAAAGTAASLLYPNSNAIALTRTSSQYLDDANTTTQVPNHMQTSTWSMSAWIQPTSLNGNSGGGGVCTDGTASEVLSLGDNNAMRICASAAVPNTVYLRVAKRISGSWGACISSNSFTLNDGAWHHVAATSDGSNINVYLDGTKTTCAEANTQYYDRAKPVTIGKNGNSGSYYFGGYIDEVRSYGRSLSETEMRLLYLGGQPGATSATITASSALNVDGHLTIGTGTLSMGSIALNVAKSWLNFGGRFSGGTGTVTLDGTSSGQEIITNFQPFYALTLDGVGGGWTVGDALNVLNTTTLTNGTLDSSSKTVRIGTLTKAAGGTFTPSTGTLILSNASDQTLTVSTAVNNLRIEDATESGLVGYWKFDRPASTTALDTTGNSNTGNLTNGATFAVGSSNLASTIKFDNVAAVELDGSNDYVTANTNSFPVTNTPMTIAMWVYYTALPGAAKAFFEMVDGSTNGIKFGFNSSNAIEATKYTTGTGASLLSVSVSNTTTYPLSTWRHVAYTYDGYTHRIYIDGVEKTSSTTATVTATPSSARIGARTTGAEYFAGRIDDVRVYDVALNSTEVAALGAGKYAIRGGTSTFTLANDTTVSGNFYLDSGTLGLSSYTLNVAGSFYAYGGSLSGTGTVKLNGTASGKQIQSTGVRFPNLTIGGANGAWTMLDRLWVPSTLAITAGTLATGNYVIHAGKFAKTNGAGAVFTPGTGTVVLDSSSSQIFTCDTAVNNLRVEDPTETNLVGYWKLDEPIGVVAYDSSASGYNGTVSGPAQQSSELPATSGTPSVTFDNAGAYKFDGIDDGISFSFPSTTSSQPTKITVSAFVKLPTTRLATPAEDYPRVIELSGATAAFFVFQIRQADSDKLGVTARWTSNTANWKSNSGITRNTWQHVAVTYDGGSTSNNPIFYINGSAVGTTTTTAPTGGTSRTAGDGTGYIGSNSGNANPFEGYMDDVRVYDDVLTASEIAALAAGTYTGRGGVSRVTLQANNTVSGSTTVDSGATQTVYRAYDDAATAGTVEGFPTAAFSWLDYDFHATYVLYNNVNSGTGDKLYKRNTNGEAVAEWSLPTNGNFVGSPKWTHDAGDPGSYYVYVIDASGNAYKLLDNGSSFTQSATYRDGSNATATSPLSADTTNIYWLGNQGAAMSTPMIFRLPQATFTSPGSVGATANNGAVATVATVSGSSYLFFANGTKLYRTDVSNLGAPTASTFSNANGVYGRVTVQGNVIYYVDNAGTLFAANPADLTAASWSYHDNTNHNGCAAGGACAAKNVFVDGIQGRAFYGDADGHVYAVDLSTHTVLSNYPFRPGSASDVFEAAPLYRSGVLVFGTTAGTVYLVDQKSNMAGAPALITSYSFESGVSTISWDFDGSQYMVGTNNGKLYYISQVADPTSSYN